MPVNLVGLATALSAFFGIWFGHFAVRKIDFISRSVWVPAITAALLGIALQIGAYYTSSAVAASVLGILGMTFIWDAVEFFRQHHRVEMGHAPANPDNPRHARLLAESSAATTYDPLKRSPTGRPLNPTELQDARGETA